jgi:hypothetical protein
MTLKPSTRQRLALTLLLLGVAMGPAAGADASASGPAAALAPVQIDATSPPAADADAAAAEPAASNPARHHRPRHSNRAASANTALEDRVKLLTAELNLDAKQQTGVREALIAERTQTIKVWNDHSIPAPLRIKATKDISTRTGDRIRALLNAEQRKKYIQPKPAEAGVQDAGDAEKWLSKMPKQ